MNTHGFNRAALNASASRIVAGAALFAVAFTGSADGLVTKFGEAVASSTSSASASGVRNVLGAAQLAATSSATASGVIATNAEAICLAKSGFKASYTEAWFSASSSGEADGVITRPGEALAVSSFTASATPLVIYGTAATGESRSGGYADPSVKLSGQTTWQRDGFALFASNSKFEATPLRIAGGDAAFLGTSSAEATPSRIAGGEARFECHSNMTALGAIEFVLFHSMSSMIAEPTVTQFGEALAAQTSTFAAIPTNTRPGMVDVMAGNFVATADGRIAIQGEAAMHSSSGASASGRLALQGEAQSQAISDMSADPVVIKFAEAQAATTFDFTAHWAVLRTGAATFAGHSGFTAFPITNPSVPAPPERTMQLAAEARLMELEPESRLMEVP